MSNRSHSVVRQIFLDASKVVVTDFGEITVLAVPHKTYGEMRDTPSDDAFWFMDGDLLEIHAVKNGVTHAMFTMGPWEISEALLLSKKHSLHFCPDHDKSCVYLKKDRLCVRGIKIRRKTQVDNA